MNAYAALAIGSTLLIPTALLYRVLNPIPPTPKPYRRVVGGLQMCDIRHVQEAWAGKPQEELLAHYDREAELDRIQLAEEAKTAAEAARIVAVKEAEFAAFKAHPVVKAGIKIASFCFWAVLIVVALILLALVGFAVCGLVGVFTIKILFLALMISWWMNDFKKDIADEVIARQKSEK